MWIFDPLRKYAVFEGRARRSEYWGFILLCALVGMLAAFVDIAIGADVASGFGPGSVVMMLLLTVPSIALTARRLHDLDYSGWWMLLAFVPYAGLIVVLLIGLAPGTRGDNRFGPDPRAQPALAA
jgi:uncharacterized membrane protein YhaH (DUF805 family)